MANTNFLKERVEPYVRSWLANRFGKPLRSIFLPLNRVKDRPAKLGAPALSQKGWAALDSLSFFS